MFSAKVLKLKELSYVKNIASGLFWNSATKLHERTLFTIKDFLFILDSYHKWINDFNQKESSNENNVNKNGPKNLASFWLNSFLFGIVVYFFAFLNYIRG